MKFEKSPKEKSQARVYVCAFERKVFEPPMDFQFFLKKYSFVILIFFLINHDVYFEAHLTQQ